MALERENEISGVYRHTELGDNRWKRRNVSNEHKDSIRHVNVLLRWNCFSSFFFSPFRTVISIFFIGICTDTSVLEAV